LIFTIEGQEEVKEFEFDIKKIDILQSPYYESLKYNLPVMFKSSGKGLLERVDNGRQIIE